MSDHISGPRALADPIADITDVYAFPSPERPDHLVLVMNTLPFAQPTDLFSDGLLYRFRLRPLAPSTMNGGAAPFVVDGDQVVIDCVFSDPTAGEASRPLGQEGTCTVGMDGSVTCRVGDPEGGSGPGVRVFAAQDHRHG
jgi:hypothetical protein